MLYCLVLDWTIQSKCASKAYIWVQEYWNCKQSSWFISLKAIFIYLGVSWLRPQFVTVVGMDCLFDFFKMIYYISVLVKLCKFCLNSILYTNTTTEKLMGNLGRSTTPGNWLSLNKLLHPSPISFLLTADEGIKRESGNVQFPVHVVTRSRFLLF